MTEQREKVYSERRRVLDGEDLEPQIEAFRDQAITSIVEAGTAEGRPDEWDLDALWSELGRLYPVGLTQDEVVEALGGKDVLTSERLIEELGEDIAVAYEDAEARIEANALAHVQLGEEPMRTLERRILLAVVDKRWREHLYEMDYLKEGIGLRAMAQRDPLVEYANEGARMFRAMMEGIREETVEQIFANVARFDAAAQRAAEDGTVEAAQAVAKANATAAAGIRVGQESGQGRGTVLGDTGQASMEQRVTYSGPSESGEEETSGASSRRASRSNADSGGNRAERRRSKKKRRH